MARGLMARLLPVLLPWQRLHQRHARSCGRGLKQVHKQASMHCPCSRAWPRAGRRSLTLADETGGHVEVERSPKPGEEVGEAAGVDDVEGS